MTPRHPSQILRGCAAVLAAGVLLGALSAAPVAAEAAMARTATALVVAVEGREVILDAGRQAGLTVTAQVTLLREGEPIVHPLTGEVLGVPQEPVGTLRVFEVDDWRARAGIVKTYSEPRPGDLAEYQPVPLPPPPPPPEPDPAVTTVIREVEALKASVQRVSRQDETLKGYPEFTRRVADEIAAMRSYLGTLDKRLVEVERQQGEDHLQLTSLASGEGRPDDMREFTIRYAPDTQVRLRTAGRTLTIEVIADSLRMEPLDEPVAMASPKPEEGGGMEGLIARLRSLGAADEGQPLATAAEAEAEGVVPWYQSPYHLAAGVGLTVAMLVMVFLVIRRRYTDVMDGLEEFEDEHEGYLEDEDEDEDEDDEDDDDDEK